MGAANALWALVRKTDTKAKSACCRRDQKSRLESAPAAVGSLASLPSGYEKHQADVASTCDSVLKDKEPAVVIGAGMSRPDQSKNPAIRLPGVSLLQGGAAADPHLRYEAAWHLAKYADEKSISTLLGSDDANVRLAGLIAIDVACFEDFPTKKAALAALGKALENPGKLDHQLLLEVARLDGDASIVPALEKLIARDDLPTATIAKAVLVLKAKAGGSLASTKLSAAAGKRLIEAVEKGQLKIASPADQLVIFEFLESRRPDAVRLEANQRAIAIEQQGAAA